MEKTTIIDDRKHDAFVEKNWQKYQKAQKKKRKNARKSKSK